METDASSAMTPEGDAITDKSVGSKTDVSTNSGHDDEEITSYLTGWRFHWTMAGLCLGSFMAQFEFSIVTTALVAITNDLEDYADASWVINAYLITWSGFLILWAQFSHTIGRRPCLALALCFFIVFSAGCAAAQNMVQLIVIRAFQGMAGAGVFNMSMVIFAETVTPEAFPKNSAIMSSVAALAFAIGPFIGGGIAGAGTTEESSRASASTSAWRWVFILNVPACLIILCLCMISIPVGFPFHNHPKDDPRRVQHRALSRLDIVGAIFFLGFSVLLVTALQEAGIDYAWSSPTIVSLLVFSVISLLCFLGWEWSLFARSWPIEPILAWKFTRRKPLGLLLSATMIGVPFTTVLVLLPQQFQVLHGASPLEAGEKLLPYILLMPIGAGVASASVGKFKMPLTAGLLIASALQLSAAVSFAVLPVGQLGSPSIPALQYGLQVLLGFGNGMSIAYSVSCVPFLVYGQRDWIAPLLGANSQFRFLGGAIGLGIATTAYNAYVRPKLYELLQPEVAGALLQSTAEIGSLPPDVRLAVLNIFGQGFQVQWKVVSIMIGVQMVASLVPL